MYELNTLIILPNNIKFEGRGWGYTGLTFSVPLSQYNYGKDKWGRSASALMASMSAWTDRQPNTQVPGVLWSKSSEGRYAAWIIRVEFSGIQEDVFLYV